MNALCFLRPREVRVKARKDPLGRRSEAPVEARWRGAALTISRGQGIAWQQGDRAEGRHEAEWWKPPHPVS